MKRRIAHSLLLASALLAVCTFALFVWSFWADPSKQNISFGENFHVSVLDGRIWFFSDMSGPYQGGIIALSDDGEPKLVRRGFGDFAGICYRYFRRTEWPHSLWTLSVSLLYPLAIFAPIPVWRGMRWTWAKWLAAFRQTDVDSPDYLLSSIYLYRSIGILGAVTYSVAVLATLDTIREPSPMFDLVATLSAFCFIIVIFLASILVAHRLAKKPEGSLRYARIVAIILATAWFPILTVPGIYCVRRVTRYIAAHGINVAPTIDAAHPVG